MFPIVAKLLLDFIGKFVLLLLSDYVIFLIEVVVL